MSDEEPKIIIDDDWKDQVAKEKAGKTEAAEPAVEESSPSPPSEDVGNRPPAASLDGVVTMFFSQCLMSLGQIPGPDGQPGEVNKPYAKFFIDCLEITQQKMEGNLDEAEAKMVGEALHAMRMAYVQVKAS